VKPTQAKQAVSTWPAAALVVSNMIGTGVFTSLGFQIAGFSHKDTSMLTDSVFPIIMLWVVGGVLALCGALCYAELATALPKSGGEYNFLSRIYHPMVGFCTGLTSVIIGFTAPIALSALAFGQYICQAFPAIEHAMPNNGAKIMAMLLVVVATSAHLRSIRFTGVFQATATVMTVLLLISFVVFGFATAKPQPIVFHPHHADWALVLSSAFFSSLFWVMYSYSGWNAAAYIVEEVRDPAKALPRALILGTGFVILLYVAVNAVFLYSTPMSAMAGKFDVAHFAGVQIFGEAGARITSGLICVGLVANVSGMMWVGSRVTEAMGSTYSKLSFFGRVSATRVPYVALIFQFLIVFSFLFARPDEIVNYVSSVLWFWSLLTVVGVIVLRFREPSLARPYRTWGYPVTPIIFAIVTAYCLIENYSYYPTQSQIGAATVLLGIPLYLWVNHRKAPAEQQVASNAEALLET
jgi:APA family basic amino acid/polyamine antiporter